MPWLLNSVSMLNHDQTVQIRRLKRQGKRVWTAVGCQAGRESQSSQSQVLLAENVAIARRTIAAANTITTRAAATMTRLSARLRCICHRVYHNGMVVQGIAKARERSDYSRSERPWNLKAQVPVLKSESQFQCQYCGFRIAASRRFTIQAPRMGATLNHTPTAANGAGLRAGLPGAWLRLTIQVVSGALLYAALIRWFRVQGWVEVADILLGMGAKRSRMLRWVLSYQAQTEVWPPVA